MLALAGELLLGYFFVLPLVTNPLVRWMATWDKEVAKVLEAHNF